MFSNPTTWGMNNIGSYPLEDSTSACFSSVKQRREDIRQEDSATFSQKFKKRTGRDILTKRKKAILDNRTPHDQFFDNCIDKFLGQSYNSSRQNRSTRVRAMQENLQNRSMNSNTYCNFSTDVYSMVENSSSLFETDIFRAKKTQNSRLPKISRKAILNHTKEEQKAHPRLAKLIYQNHPKSYMKPEADISAQKVEFPLVKKQAFFLTDISVPDIEVSVDIYESDSESSLKNQKIIHQYQYPQHLKITNQEFNDFFEFYGKGYRLKFDLKKLRQSFQAYIKLRDEMLGNKYDRKDLENRLKLSENLMKLAKIKALRKRLLEGATIRLAMLTERAIKHSAGFELMRYLKDTVREDWEWYLYKIPFLHIDICSWTPTNEELLERKILRRKPKFELNDNDDPGNIKGYDGLNRRKGFNATADPKSNPFGKKMWNARARRFTRVVEEPKSLGIRLGDPASPVISKWTKGLDYSSYWLDCVNRCLTFDNLEDIDEVGYVATLKDKPNRVVANEIVAYLT